LFYYKSQSNNKLQPKGFIPLSGADIDTSRVKKLKIRITSQFFSRIYELKAENVNEYERWVREMRKATVENQSRTTQKERDEAAEARKEIQLERVKTIVLFDRSQLPPTPEDQPSAQERTMSKADKHKSIRQALQQKKRHVSLDDFEILCVIGRGSFGKVMKVRDLDTGEIFAMKAIKKASIIESNMLESTKNEQLIMATVRHPFIVGLHYAFQSPERLYLVQDFLSGGELFYHLQQETKFSVEKAKFYSAEIYLAIDHLHKMDIIYRDLKPENIVLDGQGHAVLTDFGLSKTKVSNSDQTYTFCGTPECMKKYFYNTDKY
jgi:serine/threonine protein kinase